VIARTVRVVAISSEEMQDEKGWTAPTGWRIVNTEHVDLRVTHAFWRVTIVKS
jgi:hypothetical protein